MRPQGKRKFRGTLARHQHCSICHPEQKSMSTRERQARQRIVEAGVADLDDDFMLYIELMD
jgi:hypothetical protein